jgi:para-nitrobenzyl esterase
MPFEIIASREVKMNLVKTDKGYISGTIIGEYGQEVNIFRGIPYAAPPIGELRWRPPQPVASWKGIRECTTFSCAAPQLSMPGLSAYTPVSEDCLYLNVLTPARKASANLPVMVWMHGGGYSMGSGNDKIWNNTRILQYGVIVVLVNTRLGSLALLAHPLLSKESPHKSSGNYLFLDLIAALKWVQKNIADFGGNPDNVTIFGESGGGAKVANMMASPLAKGLFHRAICESGTALGGFAPSVSLKKMEAAGEKLFTKLGVTKESNPLAAARSIRWEKILEAEKAVNEETFEERTLDLWDAAVDGWYLKDTPTNIFRSGKHNAVPLITCANLGEVAGKGGLQMPYLITCYVNMLSWNSQAGAKSYACIFDKVPANWKKEGCGSIHSMELTYVFGDWDNSTGWWHSIFMLAGQSGAKSPVPRLTGADRKVSEAMMAMWSRFARTGKPDVPGLISWPEYKPNTDKYLYISEPMRVKTGFSNIAK